MSESASIRTLWREYADASAHSLKMWPESSRFDALPQCHPITDRRLGRRFAPKTYRVFTRASH
jgi:hypothetical protein